VRPLDPTIWSLTSDADAHHAFSVVAELDPIDPKSAFLALTRDWFGSVPVDLLSWADVEGSRQSSRWNPTSWERSAKRIRTPLGSISAFNFGNADLSRIVHVDKQWQRFAGLFAWGESRDGHALWSLVFGADGPVSAERAHQIVSRVQSLGMLCVQANSVDVPRSWSASLTAIGYPSVSDRWGRDAPALAAAAAWEDSLNGLNLRTLAGEIRGPARILLCDESLCAAVPRSTGFLPCRGRRTVPGETETVRGLAVFTDAAQTRRAIAQALGR
jgi:hypothetical protein